MTERIMRELIEEEGLTEEVARLRLQDTDLWLLHPGVRFDDELTGEEGVRLWEEAARVARTVADAISNGPDTIQAGPAVTMLAWDAAERAQEALRRARGRVGMRGTVFGQVLAELLEERGLPVTPLYVGTLAEDAGLDGRKVLGRMADAGAEGPGHLDGLDVALDLSEPEKRELSFAYVYERRYEA